MKCVPRGPPVNIFGSQMTLCRTGDERKDVVWSNYNLIPFQVINYCHQIGGEHLNSICIYIHICIDAFPYPSLKLRGLVMVFVSLKVITRWIRQFGQDTSQNLSLCFGMFCRCYELHPIWWLKVIHIKGTFPHIWNYLSCYCYVWFSAVRF